MGKVLVESMGMDAIFCIKGCKKEEKVDKCSILDSMSN